MADSKKEESKDKKSESKTSTSSKSLVDVQILHTSPVNDGKIKCITTDGHNCYLVPRDKIKKWDIKAKFSVNVDDSDIEEAYDWESEIEKMLPNREETKNAIRKSLWLSGSLKKGEVKPKARQWAFPWWDLS